MLSDRFQSARSRVFYAIVARIFDDFIENSIDLILAFSSHSGIEKALARETVTWSRVYP